MSAEFILYGTICVAALGVTFVVMGPARLARSGGLAKWYLVVFALTYLIRPAGTQLWGDDTAWTWLRLGSFEPYWKQFAAAVVMALLSFAVGCRVADAEGGAKSILADTPWSKAMKRGVAVVAIAIGYLSILIALAHPATLARDASGNAFFVGSSFYITGANVLIAAGALLVYLLTGRLWLSLTIAAPWVAMRLASGWARSDLIGLFFAFLAVHEYRTRVPIHGRRPRKTQLAAIVVAAALVVVAFPILGIHRVSGGISWRELGEAFDAGIVGQHWFRSTSDIQGFETSVFHLQDTEARLYGSTYLYYFFIVPIPRLLWPDKPLLFTLGTDWFGFQLDPWDTSGWVPGSIGEAFENWGWLGIAVEFLFSGWLLRRIELRASGHPESLNQQYVLASFYWLVPLMGRDTILTIIGTSWLFTFAPIVGALWWIDRRHRLGMPTAAASALPPSTRAA